MAEMTAQESAEWGKGHVPQPSPKGESSPLDFPAVWAALMENRAQINKLAEKIDCIAANADKIDKLEERVAHVTNVYEIDINELDKLKAKIDTFDKDSFNELKAKVEDVRKNVGGLNLSMGDLIEVLFAPHLGEKFDAYNYNLRRIYRRVPIYDDNARLRSDIDFLLSNTTVCMAVEVKRWLEHKKDIDDHIKRMQLIRQYPPAEVKGKKLLGAIVGALVHPDARAYAEQNGFFVLELTGKDVRLLEPPKDFQPKEW